MKHSDFKIGGEFTTDEGRRKWRCTDIGTRIVTAIQIDSVSITTHYGGKYKSKVLSQQQADDDGWFNGPPYSVAEVVFDENDQPECCKIE